MKRRRALKVGQIWVSHKAGTRTKTRRIVQILEGRIFYSTERAHVRSCGPSMFRLWVRTYKSTCATPGRLRTLVLAQAASR